MTGPSQAQAQRQGPKDDNDKERFENELA